ncbi:MAG: hypothetical protein ACPLRP_03055 [Candidatus Bipolaricaulaceae bacterium]
MEIFELVSELAGKHRYAGTENERWACGLIADRLGEIGCMVEFEETADLVELFVHKLNRKISGGESG